ncbi:hypothetical protein BH10BAC4_BH10BAC4_06770 [soil metagenome]
MKKVTLLSILLLQFLVWDQARAQNDSMKALREEIIKMEKSFAEAIKGQDSIQAAQLQSESFFLGIAVQGLPIQVVTRSQWLSNLKYYVTESYSIDDIKVSVFGNTAVVMMLYTQKATVRGQDRSAQFLITDIWNKGKSGWKISERHSGRPEQGAAVRPK